MPIYEYECKKCGSSFEHLAASMAATDTTVDCPACHSRQTKRKMSVFAVAATASAGNASMASPGGMCGCGRKQGSCGGM